MSLSPRNWVNPLSTLALLALVTPSGAAVFGLVVLGYKAHDSFHEWLTRGSSAQTNQILSLQQELSATKDSVAKLQHDVKNLTLAKLGRS